MSPKSDGFRAHALIAEASARAATDAEVGRRFWDIAQSWLALAEMVDRGKDVKIVAVHDSTETPDGT
jgi:hypothetical protein